MIDKFVTEAKGFAKNPLGIVALFISLIYGFACLVLGFSISNLQDDYERLPLIWFIILFPIIVLGVFVYLVVNHHEKLYSPKDFKNDSSFIEAMNKNQISKKQEKEVDYIEKAAVVNLAYSTKKNENSSKEQEQTEATQLVNRKDLLNRYLNSENWAVKEISLKFNINLNQNISYNTTKGRIELDAVGTLQDKTYMIDVKYWKSNIQTPKLKESISKFLSQKNLLNPNQKAVFVIAVVFDNLQNVDKLSIFSYVKSINNDALVEFFDYEELKKKYAQ